MTVLLASMFVLLFSLALGFPIAVSLIISSIVGASLEQGVISALGMVGGIPFSNVNGFSLLAIPMFILMGNILLEFGIGSVLFKNVERVVGHTRGGLAMASTLMCAVFGFICGSSSASCATIGGNTLPEMEKRGYDRRLALGTLATAGSIAVLIPPSIIMVVYAVLANASLGRVMIAGILPGILLTLFILIYIYVRVLIKPSLAPIDTDQVRATWAEKFTAIGRLFPIAVVFFLIIGGLFTGIWDAIEASAAGVLSAFGLCFWYFRSLSWQPIKRALIGTVETSIMIYLLIVGGNMLAYVFYITGVQTLIEQTILSLDLAPWAFLVLLGVVYMLLGVVLDVIALLTITVPIFLPIVVELGYSPVWFGIYAVLFSEMALITPPVGINLFIIKGIAPAGTRVLDVGYGSLPYVFIIWFTVLLLIVVPDIALYLPSIMR